MNNIPHIVDTGASPTEMNAYELADKLKNCEQALVDLCNSVPRLKGWLVVGDNHLEKAANMLCQQADRIALLERRFGEELDAHHSALKKIAILRKQTNPLSDEQIFKLAEMLELKVSHALYAFAKTLIKKAQEK